MPGGSASTSPTTAMTTRRGNYEAHSSEAACGKRPFECEHVQETLLMLEAGTETPVPKEFSQENNSIKSGKIN